MTNQMKTATLKKEIYHAIDNTKDTEILEAVYTILRRPAPQHMCANIHTGSAGFVNLRH